jgi:hypothetical protein
MRSRLPADLMDEPAESQFTLRRLEEAVEWAALVITYVGYLSRRSLRPEDADLAVLFSPVLLLAALGGLVGSLIGARWRCVACGVLVGAAPLLLALGLVLLVKP